jgi:hypothetical protein
MGNIPLKTASHKSLGTNYAKVVDDVEIKESELSLPLPEAVTTTNDQVLMLTTQV